MKQFLIVVDMQVDFIDGSLGTAEAVAILPKVAQAIADFDGTVLFTRDTHFENYLATQEGAKLPVPHCIKGTAGHAIHPSLAQFIPQSDALICDKLTFGAKELPAMIDAQNPKGEALSFTLIGLCTDICVISNALLLKAFYPEAKVCVDASCCAGVTPATHENALRAMQMCQIEIVNDLPRKATT
ncbi:MAG: cysteine hydrolase [Faecalibacterium sp.]